MITKILNKDIVSIRKFSSKIMVKMTNNNLFFFIDFNSKCKSTTESAPPEKPKTIVGLEGKNLSKLELIFFNIFFLIDREASRNYEPKSIVGGNI